MALTAHAQTDAQFGSHLRHAIRNSPLSAVEKAQHVLDRLGYGAHPEIWSVPNLLSYDQNGRIDDAASDTLIQDYVERSLAARSYDRPELKPLLDGFATSNASYFQISKQARDLRRIAAQKEAILLATPLLPKAAHDKASDEFKAARIESIQYRFKIVAAQRARFLAQAVTERYPLYLKLLHLWFNRFNVSWEGVSYDLPDYLEQINANTFSTFHDLLKATARHPAMMTYLHNSSNFVAYDRHGVMKAPPNEDYARELMELHTLGKVAANMSGPNDYDLKDIHQAALLLSGWQIKGVALSENVQRQFYYNADRHARGTQTVMGQRFSSGQNGGLEFLRFLSRHPLTAKSVARMLVRHFVQDSVRQWASADGATTEDLPIVTSLTQVFQTTDGDLTQVYRSLFADPAFWSREAYRSKVKDPLHLVVSTLRATGRRGPKVDTTGAVVDRGTLSKAVINDAIELMKQMSMPLFECSPPTGYADTVATWTGTANLITFVKYAFREAGYDGLKDGPRQQRYDAAEQLARAKATPAEMASSAVDGFLNSYGLNFSPWPFRMPVDQEVSPAAPTLIQFGATPDFRIRDDDSRALLPVRSIAGAYLGSAEFMKR